jgi:hypothetical protein
LQTEQDTNDETDRNHCRDREGDRPGRLTASRRRGSLAPRRYLDHVAAMIANPASGVRCLGAHGRQGWGLP